MKTTSEQTRPGRGARHMYRWLPPMGVAAAMASPAQPVQAEGPRPLSHERAEQLHGGVRVDVLFPPANNWFQGADDLRFQARIQDILYNDQGFSSAIVGLWSENAIGAGKEDYTVLNTSSPNAEMVWSTRVKWPTQGTGNGKPDARFKYYWPVNQTYYTAEGNSYRADAYLHGNVKVAQVQVYSVVSGNSSATADWSAYSRILDVRQYATPGKMDNFSDGIANQCGKADRNGSLKHWQFRLQPTVKTVVVPPACDSNGTCLPCTDLKAVYDTMCAAMYPLIGDALRSCPQLSGCISGMNGGANSTDLGSRVAVFQIETSPWGSGASFVWPHQSGYFTGITTEHMNSGDEALSRVFTHEMGHRVFALPHSTSSICSQSPADGVQDDVHPLMCPNTGRYLTKNECSTAYASNNTPDWNSL